jgi:pantoate--beta-alanine ligase
MDVIHDISSLKSKVKSFKANNFQVGLVPTMGALHKGHLSLIKKSIQDNAITCCSIYVNPTQFNNKEDLKKYPRPIENDIKLLAESGCNLVFLPNDEEMYPALPNLKFDFGHLETVMEGSFRPGHFNGVGIVVSKLFNIVNPDRAYFGQKDLQQFLIIKQMVNDLSFDLELKSVPIERDRDGLALSSRNTRLTVEERAVAPRLYEALLLGKDLFEKGEHLQAIQRKVQSFLSQHKTIKLEYFEIADGETLKPLNLDSQAKTIALCIAAFVGDVRLIDNLLLFS